MTENIENNIIHLTQEERFNLNNLGISVKAYDAIGDGNADDTSAFTEALENNNRVYVPGGTYKITGELILKEKCELELAQDAVLEFVPSNKRVVTEKETGNKTTVTIDPPMFKCITLEKESSFVGNHATIRVPYIFEGTVICTTDDSFRYLKDINIIKPVEQNNHNSIHSDLVGLPLSLNKESNGTALLIERSNEVNTSGSKELCHLDFSDVNISGAFEYGIKCINTTPGISENRNHNTHIKAVIDGCRTGVFMCNYSDARISSVITPRYSYNSVTGEEVYRFAEHGILLENSINIDLRNSRIEYHDSDSIEPDPSAEFRYILLLENCHGLMVDNSLCFEMDGYDIRDYIHTNTPENFESMTITKEPNDDYFNYYGEDAVEGFLYHNYRIETEENPGVLGHRTNTTSTCSIPCTRNSTIIVKDFIFSLDKDEQGNERPNRIAYYTENGIYLGYIKYANFNKYHLTCKDLDDGGYEISFNKTASELKNIGNIRMCCNTENIGMRPTVTVYNTDDNGITTKDVTYLKDGCLKGRIYIKPRYIDGLKETIEELSSRISTLEESN